MAKPTGTPPSAFPATANYALPPLPPSPDNGTGHASPDAQQQGGSSARHKHGQDRQQQKGGPQMTQAPATPPTRGRASSMVNIMVGNWESSSQAFSSSGSDTRMASAPVHPNTTVKSSGAPAITPRSTGTVTGAGEARPAFGHARMASSPVSPMKGLAIQASGMASVSPLGSSKPPSDVPPPLVLPRPPSDVPPPPVRAQSQPQPPSYSQSQSPTQPQPQPAKVPPLVLSALGSTLSPDSATSGMKTPDTVHLSGARISPDSSASSPLATPKTPQSSARLDTGGSLKGEDVILELRYFIDGVLEQRSDVGARHYADHLGELLVFVESRGGKAEVGSDARNSVLRGTSKINDYTTTSGATHKEVNVIKDFSQPFMNSLLGTGESDDVRIQLMRAFDKVADKINTQVQQDHEVRTSDLLKSEEFIRLMKPLEDIFMNYVCGAERTLASSRLPEKMKKLLLAVDKHLILWFQQRGTGVPRDLLQLRQNAQVGYLATRSMTAVWRNRCDEVLGLDGAKKYAKMFAYLNACASNKLNDFVLDIISNQRAQPKEVREYVRAIQSPKQLIRRKGTTVAEPASDNSVLRRGKTLHATSQLISPRAGTTAELSSPRTDEAARKLKKEQVQHQLARATFAEQIITEAGLKDIDPRFMQHLKDKIVDMSRRGFENFKLDPIPYCQKYAKEFYVYGGNVQKAVKEAPARVHQALSVADGYYRKRDQQGSIDTVTTTTTTNAKTTTTTATATTTTTTAIPSLPLGTIATRAPAPQAVRVGGVSTTRAEDESDSSIEVSTPSSTDDSWGRGWTSSEESSS